MRRGLLGVGTAVLAAGIAATSASAAPLKVSVSYRAKPCGDAPARQTRLAPVTAGTIELDRPGNGAPVRLSLAGAAPGSASLAGSGPVTAKLILQTPLVRVVDGATGNAAQRIGLGSAVVRNGRVSFVLRRSESDDGHVNTLIELQRGARFASRNAPRRLPVLTANVVDGPVASRPGTGFAAPARIVVGKGSSGFGGTGDTDAQWEPAILLHEYGHFVLHTVAPDNGPEVDHNWSTSYPEQPEPRVERGLRLGLRGAGAARLGRAAVPGLRPAGGELRGDPGAPGAGQRPRRPLRAVERDARRGGHVPGREAPRRRRPAASSGCSRACAPTAATAITCGRRATCATWW